MKKLLVFGVIVLFLGLAIAPSINANIRELSVDDTIIEASTIIEEDEEDCGCNDANTTQWNFPVICLLLWIPFFYGIMFDALYGQGIGELIALFMANIALKFNCDWAQE